MRRWDFNRRRTSDLGGEEQSTVLTDEVGQRTWVQVFTRTCDSDVRQPHLLRQLVLVATQGDSYELVAEVVCDAVVVPFESLGFMSG
jgi:hypothetical protein